MDITLKAGQWIKCINNDVWNLTNNKWYKLMEFVNEDGSIMPVVYPDNFAQPSRICYGMSPESSLLKLFDFNNPLDYNPDEVV